MKELLRELRYFLTKSPSEYADYVEDKLTIQANREVTPLQARLFLNAEDRRLKRVHKALRRSR
mgnify:CR=1 FL=1